RPCGVRLEPRLGDEVLHELLLGERAAEGMPFVRAAAHQLDRALGSPDRAHAVMDAAGAEPVLGYEEACTALAEEALLRHPAGLVADLAVAGAAVVTHHRHRPDQVEAGSVGRDEDH